MYEQSTKISAHDHATMAELEALDCSFQALSAPPVAPANPGFQFPQRLWAAMFASYAVFFIAIATATGGSGPARFALVVSALYTLVYFGIARIGARQAGPESRSPLDRGENLPTWTGPMDRKSVFAQVLVVPVVVGLFGIGIAVICAIVL